MKCWYSNSNSTYNPPLTSKEDEHIGLVSLLILITKKMFDIKFLKNSWFFLERILDSWDVLFDEWEIDGNLYIIEFWKLSIEKYTTKEKVSTKQLAILGEWDFVWEWALNKYWPKEVKILALEETKVLYIEAKKDFMKFLEKFPSQARDILVYIISITNERVLASNKYITSIYEINKSIRDLKEITLKEIFLLFEKIKIIMDSEIILFFEKNYVMKEFLTLKYDSRIPNKMQDKIVESWNFSLDEFNLDKNIRILSKEIIIAEESLWFLVIWKKEIYNENEKRIFLWIINSISGVLKQKKILEEERNKKFMRE